MTTAKALTNGYYKVAWFSPFNLASPVFPIIVGGLFTIVTITPVIFYLVLSFLVIYLISLPLAWPGRDRRLLRWHNCIADYASLFYTSYLLHDPQSQLDISAPNVTQRHLESRVFLQDRLYTTGWYNGVDGECHFGLDEAYLGETGVEPRHVRFVPYNREGERRAGVNNDAGGSFRIRRRIASREMDEAGQMV